MKERVALVTGASRGIGKAIAIELAKAGAIVVGTATSEQGATSISNYLAENGFQGEGQVLDVTSPESIEALFAHLKETVGSPSILVNNAAVTQDNLFLRMKDEQWLSAVDTNLNSVFRITKACMRGMIKARWGRVVSIGSIVGTSGNPGQTNYAAAKAGVIGFTKSLALEVASRGVTANVVAPGFVDTDMTRALSEDQRSALLTQIPLGRVAEPEEIAHVVAFLCSDKATYITGQTIHVNGGMLMQ